VWSGGGGGGVVALSEERKQAVVVDGKGKAKGDVDVDVDDNESSGAVGAEASPSGLGWLEVLSPNCSFISSYVIPACHPIVVRVCSALLLVVLVLFSVLDWKRTGICRVVLFL